MSRSAGPSGLLSLLDRRPEMSAADLLEHFTPPAQFAQATLENYVPDPNYPSQAEALDTVRSFAVGGTFRQVKKSFFGGKKPVSNDRPGIYLDGGFGVGKTHLLAALWHQTPGRTYYGTFIEYTALLGVILAVGLATVALVGKWASTQWSNVSSALGKP